VQHRYLVADPAHHGPVVRDEQGGQPGGSLELGDDPEPLLEFARCIGDLAVAMLEQPGRPPVRSTS
jgi:hypothetical protein